MKMMCWLFFITLSIHSVLASMQVSDIPLLLLTVATHAGGVSHQKRSPVRHNQHGGHQYQTKNYRLSKKNYHTKSFR